MRRTVDDEVCFGLSWFGLPVLLGYDDQHENPREGCQKLRRRDSSLSFLPDTITAFKAKCEGHRTSPPVFIASFKTERVPVSDAPNKKTKYLVVICWLSFIVEF